ncbi:hypothetical protein [Paenibacillus ginsengihumi]|uniref:hypothetical protein n=1 Tax=Paenibacillus ginsengihumi TaxID=431596 RepID=UPI000366EA38|nr:hypothetical protein [Paenibacillus ginsengihumi]
MSVAEYNEITPHELMLAVEAYNDRRQQEREQMLTQAYLTAAWQRTRKLPKLKKVLEDSRPRAAAKVQTPEQMLAITKMIHRALTERRGKNGGCTQPNDTDRG